MKSINLILLLFVLFSGSVVMAQVDVSGTITDSSGETLPGVNIYVDGTQAGTVSNIEGKYTLSVPNKEAVIVYSFTGMETEKRTVGDQIVINLVMREGVDLDEAVVTALGISRDRKSLGYAVQEVSGAAVSDSRETNIVSGLSAKVAGVQVTNGSGAAGSSSYIKIRGNASLTGNNQPLFVVDGIPIKNDQQVGSNFDLRDGVALSNRAIDINPDDIETMSVLKGGAAAALYGSRGANGVILITTKKGKQSADGTSANITFSSTLELSSVNKLPAIQNSYSQGTYKEVANPDSGSPFSFGTPIGDVSYDGDTSYPFNSNGRIIHKDSLGANGSQAEVYDHTGDFFRTGIKQQYSLGFNGATKYGTFFMSYSYLGEDGVVPLNTYDRNTFRLSSSNKFGERFNVDASVAYTNSSGSRIQQGSNTSGLMLGLLRTSPTFDNSNGVEDAEDPASYLLADGSQRNYRGGGGYDNPYWTINQNPFKDRVNRVFGYGKVGYKVNDWLTANARVGSDYYNDSRKQIFSIGSRTDPAGSILEDVYSVSETTADLFFTFQKDLSEDISVNGLIGNTWNHRYFRNDYVAGNGLNFPGFYNINNTASINGGNSTEIVRTSGTYLDVNASYKDTYYVGFTGRQDAASTFGIGNESTFFYPSVSAAVILSEILELDKKIVSFAKLRASYANVGSEPGAYATKTYYSSASPYSGWTNFQEFPFQGVSAFTLGNVLGNNELRPESTATFEVGADLSFFQNKLTVDATYYSQYSSDLILNVPVAASSGYTSRTINAGEMSNKGIELTLGVTPVSKEDFKWMASVNFTRNRNVVEKLADGVDVVDLPWGFTGANQRLVEGEAYGTLYGSVWERDNSGNVMIDANGVPITAANDDIIGDPNPDWLMGINNAFEYKDFKFSFLWDIREGGDIWNGTKGALYYFGTHEDTAEDRYESFVYEGVYAPGTEIGGEDVSGQANTTELIKDIDWYAGGPGSGFTGPSEQFIEDGGWIRLRQVSLTYDLGKFLKDSKTIKGLTFGVTARNLFLSTDYTGVDPETSLTGNTNAQGADYFNMPNTKSWSFTLKANF
jgi:TonB-linked SusC/RagA family outer membrane protein